MALLNAIRTRHTNPLRKTTLTRGIRKSKRRRNVLKPSTPGGSVGPGPKKATPKDLPGDCCADTDAMTLMCTSKSHPLHDSVILSVETINDNGLVTLTYRDPAGVEKSGRFPLCEMPSDCCYDAVKGVIVCDDLDDPKHGKPADMTDDFGNGLVYVCGAFDPNSSAQTCIRLPLCPDEPPEQCCYDAVNDVLVCTVAGPSPHPLHGQKPQIVKITKDTGGRDAVVAVHPGLNDGNRTVIPLCPEQPPIECCYNLAGGTLRCPGDARFDNVEVSLIHLTDVMQDGRIYAVVSHPELPGGRYQFPLCDDEVPPNCCYDGSTGLVVCEVETELDGQKAGVVHKYTGPDERPWVYVTWNGGGARMPLCDEECPPIFCCVNINTGVFVCPGESSLNGQPADMVDVITDANGFNYVKLGDGTLVPVCGEKCPPPEICPDCPPGMWRSPDKECVPPPDCPEPEPCIPPGRIPPDRVPPGRIPPGQRVPPTWTPPIGDDCDTCPPVSIPLPGYRVHPWWDGEGHCCEMCALGLACEGGCDCGGSHELNPVSYPASHGRAPTTKAWVQLKKGSKYGKLHTPGGPVYKVRLHGRKKNRGGVMAKVKAVTRKGRPVTLRSTKARRNPRSFYDLVTRR